MSLLSEKQKAGAKVLLGDAKEILLDGSARSGKTHLIISFLLNEAQKNPVRILVARLRFNHLISTLWHQTLLPLMDKYFDSGAYRINHADHWIKINGKNGPSEIWAAGLDDYTRVQKILGSEYNFIFLNEAVQIPFNTYQVVKTRCVKNIPGVKNKIITDCNPANQFHWLHQYFIDRLNPDTLEKHKIQVERFGPWLPSDNPHLSQDGLDMINSLTGASYERYALGLWVSTEGLVYPEYHKAIVEPFKIPDSWELFGGVDFGYSNPFGFLWVAYHHAEETYYIFDEYYQREKTVKEHCAFLRGYVPAYLTEQRRLSWIVADHDAEDRATMSQEGFPTRAARKDIKTGIENMRNLLAAQKGFRVRIFNTCTHLISELAGYKWPEKKYGDDRDEKPVKGADHLCDTARYICMEFGSGSKVVNFGRLRTRNE